MTLICISFRVKSVGFLAHISMYTISHFKNSYALSLGIYCEIQWLYGLTPKLDGMSDTELLAKYIKENGKSELNKL